MYIRKVKLSKETLETIKKIDELFYKDSKLTIDWYLERYKEYHCGILLFNEKWEIVGYLVCVPIKKELYNQFIAGNLDNDVEIDPCMFLKRSKYNYIASTVILKKYRKKGYGTQMMELLLKDAKDKNYCSISVSEEGYKLLRKKLNVVKKATDKVYVFEKSNINNIKTN